VTADEPEYLYLTTTGRRTGEPREIEIWFTACEGRYYVVAEHREKAQWVQNVRADSRVSVRVGVRIVDATARVVDAQVERKLHETVQELSRSKYGWGEGLVVELEPTKTK
jgi:deazaflavin-dependent oxidoreductase (nitroreductase family)